MSLTCWLDGNGDRLCCSGQSYQRRLARPFFCITRDRIIFAEQDDPYVTLNITLVVIQFKYVSQGLP